MSLRHVFKRLAACLASLLLGLAFIAGLTLLLPAWQVRAAPAASLTVTTTADELNSDGDCSLREAIQAANTDAAVDQCGAGSGLDSISLPAGTYTLTVPFANEDANASGDLDATDAAGLTITGAGASLTIINANSSDRVLHALAGPLTLSGLTLRRGLVAGDGGALYATGALTLSDVSLLSSISLGYGGGLYAAGPARLTGVTLVSNTATFGGGLYAAGPQTLTSVSLISNTATTGDGGGAFFVSAARLTDVTFQANTAPGLAPPSIGGGAYFNASATLSGGSFLSNTAKFGAGGAYFFGAATVTGTTFAANHATFGGGAYLAGSGAHSLVNVLFARNAVSNGQGAALYMVGSHRLQLVHATIASPTLAYASAVYIQAGTAFITNTIVASHTFGLERVGGTLIEDYNLFSGNTDSLIGAITSGGHSLTGTTAFLGPAADDYHLLAGSAALDAGTDAGVATDFEGHPRPGPCGSPDIGYDERPEGLCLLSATGDLLTPLGTPTRFTASVTGSLPISLAWDFGDLSVASGAVVSHTYTALGSYTATVTATNAAGSLTATALVHICSLTVLNTNDTGLGSLREAVACAPAGATVVFSPTLAGQTITLTSQIYTTRQLALEGSAAPGVRLSGGGTTRILFLEAPASLTDLTLQLGSDPGYVGGALWTNSPLTLTRVNVLSSTAAHAGGLYAGSSAVLIDTLFQGNTSAGETGGAFVNESATLSGTAFISNSAGTLGGGGTFLGPLSLTGGTFQGNTAGLWGGGGYFGAANITGTTFVDNRAAYGGGVFLIQPGDHHLANLLFARNSASANGAAIFVQMAASVSIVHTTIASPTLASGAAVAADYVGALPGTVYLTNTIVASHTVGLDLADGTLNEDYNLFFGNTSHLTGTVNSGGHSLVGGEPNFINPAADDYHLGLDSAARNAGTDAGLAFDFDGDPRPLGDGFDIGYDEAEVPNYHLYLPLVRR